MTAGGGSIILGYSETIRKIRRLLKPMVLDNDKLKKLVAVISEELEQGLTEPKPGGVRMLPTYVRALPNNTEKGDYLALDLGGTNFRVLLVTLEGKEAKMQSSIYRIPQELMLGEGHMLFDHIAECLARFIKEYNLGSVESLPLGFTFSFPCSQNGLASGTLITWTKGFKSPGVEGKDVVKLLQEAVDKRGDIKNVDIVAILNDTTGTLMSCAHVDPRCTIGVIVGTGSNACYLEKLSRIPKLPDQPAGPNEMLVNTEWGSLGENGRLDFVRTSYDHEVDMHTINPGKQLFEKMISGMYLGEIVRVVLCQLTKEGVLFGGLGSPDLFKHGSFPTKFVSEIEEDLFEEDQTFFKTHEILLDLGIEGITARDMSVTAYVCTVISARAAFLSAAGIAALANKIGRKEVTIGVDGSVYKFHPTFKDLLEEKLLELINPDIKPTMMLSEDGSGRGAALVAAVAYRLAQEKLKERRERFQKQMEHAESFGLSMSVPS